MHVDDRLATVLRHRAAGERAARVQFRQLLDLLGAPAAGIDPDLTRAAFRRLDSLGKMIPLGQRERIAAECSPRIRNAGLLGWFAAQEPRVALAALSRASLSEAQWTALIPDIPARARGLLRHRRNLPAGAQALLDRLGVRDRVLPEPILPPPPIVLGGNADTLTDADVDATPLPALDLGVSLDEIYVLDRRTAVTRDDDPASDDPTPADPAPAPSDLAALVRRIDEFQRTRGRRAEPDAKAAPGIATDGEPDRRPPARVESFLFTTDTNGRIDWAEAGAAPQIVGTLLASPSAMARDLSDTSFAAAFARQRPVTGAVIEVTGAETIAGSWIVDGAPRFTPRSGSFQGFVGRFRRPAPVRPDTRALQAADRIRQLLHELRTPVTAIQGFAEVIQQQTVGPVPHEYRALAAEIASDAARMLAGFAEIERLARVEAGIQEFPEGTSDFATVVRRQVAQLQTVLSPRVSRIEASWTLREARVALAPETAEMLAWRYLGTLAAATAAGERITVDLTASDGRLQLTAALPAALASIEDVFSSDIRSPGGALGTGLFGAGFALRLARAEARACGGDVVREHAAMILTLPLGEGFEIEHDDPDPTAESISPDAPAAARLP